MNTNPQKRHDGWPVTTPESANLDPQELSDITRSLANSYEYPNVHAVLIEHAGHLVYEHYLQGQDGILGDRRLNVNSLHDLQSVSKSVTALLLGIAFGDDIEDALEMPIAEFYEDRNNLFSTEARSVTLHQVLSMTAGFEWDESSLPYTDPDNDGHRLFQAKDPIAFILERPLIHSPGSVWAYNGGLTELLVDVIEQRTGKRLREFASDTLFGPLGIENFEWWGSWNWDPGGRPSAAGGLRMRARDLAKIGSLVLHDGFWEGQAIVSPGWIKLLGQRYGEESTADGSLYGYGYQWWVVNSGSIPPYNIVGGFGWGGQRLLIVPEHHLVLTVFAGNYDSYSQDMGNRILHRVVAAHREHEG